MDPFQETMLGMMLFMSYMHLSDLKQARILVNRLEKTSAGASVPPLAKLIFLEAAGYWSWMVGDLDQNEKVTEQGIAFAKEQGLEFRLPWMWESSVFRCFIRGDLLSAEQFINNMRPFLGDGTKAIDRGFHYHAGWLAFLQGKLQEAKDELQHGIHNSQAGGAVLVEMHGHVGLTQVLHALGEEEGAEEHLSIVREFSRQLSGSIFDPVVALLEAQWAFDRGEEETGYQRLQSAFQIWRRGLECHAFWDAKVLTRLCVKALESDIEIETAQRKIRKFSLYPPEPPFAINNWPWTIRVTTLGRFAVEGDQGQEEAGRKVPNRVLVFLKALIAFGGQEVPDTHVMDALWPEADGDQAARTCRTNIHRLRKLLRDDNTVTVKDGKISLDPYLVWVDAWAFEYVLREADAAQRNGDTANSLSLCERAMQLYPGVFLPDDEADPWTAPHRERLRKKYRTNIETLCTAWCRDGRKADARVLLEHAKTHEPKAEALYQSLLEE